MFVDNFYIGIGLFDALRARNIGACGTVCVSREGLPPDMARMKKKRGELPTIWEKKDKTMLACSWQDTCRVNMLSTIGSTGTEKVVVKSKKGNRLVDKPSVQILYDKYIGGVDKFDHLCSTYPFKRRTKKWYQTLWHFVIEVALVNSLICYNVQNPEKKSKGNSERK